MTIASAVRGPRNRLAWALPLVVAGAVLGGVLLSRAGSSTASPTLPSRSAAQLLADVQRSTATALSGTVKETANLGLPSLPGSASSASLSWQSFITGTHQARVWVDGRDKQRVALIGELSEADVIHNGREVWTYTSDTNTVTHTVLGHRAVTPTRPNASEYTPAEIAARVLKAVTPSTSVTVDTSRMVAGRAAYTLVLRPRDARSTVREIAIAIDAHKYVPLRVQVFGAGSTPALVTGFTSVTFATPPASTFVFHQPAGSTMSSDPLGSPGEGRHVRPGVAHRAPLAIPGAHPSTAPKVIGTGWTSVVELTGGLGDGRVIGMVGDLTSSVGTSNARLLHTALINAVLLPDGRVFVGAVTPALLEHIAATSH